MTDQEYVESRWEKVRLDRGSFLRLDKIIHEDSGNFRVLADHPTMSGAKLILSGNSNSLFERSHHLSQPAAWMAARAFTEAHEEKIRQLREEIAEQNGYLFPWHGVINGAFCTENCAHIVATRNVRRYRTVARLEEELAVMMRGWKNKA
jgi:hypothetical protein